MLSGVFERKAFEGRRVFLTGHTGFKGAWLTRWLLAIGADVAGYSLPAGSTQENYNLPIGVQPLFDELGLRDRIVHTEGDVADLELLCSSIDSFKPDYVFHLAAQALVRASYRKPVETFSANVLGTINLLESLRRLARPVIGVIVTSDKVYANDELARGYTEDDRLGGHDPYSCSKAMCELAVDSFRKSFFADLPIKIATARAGNVIGGGDWAIDRIVPDCIRSLRESRPIEVRNPHAIRPWQHVLEPLGAYLSLAAKLAAMPQALCTAFNFGPPAQAQRAVSELVDSILQHWPQGSQAKYAPSQSRQLHETQVLALRTDKAEQLLGWKGLWDFEQTVANTVLWYRQHNLGRTAEELTLGQIELYQQNSIAVAAKKNHD